MKGNNLWNISIYQEYDRWLFDSSNVVRNQKSSCRVQTMKPRVQCLIFREYSAIVRTNGDIRHCNHDFLGISFGSAALSQRQTFWLTTGWLSRMLSTALKKAVRSYDESRCKNDVKIQKFVCVHTQTHIYTCARAHTHTHSPHIRSYKISYLVSDISTCD